MLRAAAFGPKEGVKMKTRGFLTYYTGCTDFDLNVVLAKTATDCAKFLGVKLCHAPGCEDHNSMGPHAHILASQFGETEQFPEVPSKADFAGMSYRRFTAKGVTIFWILGDKEAPPLVYFREAKLVVGYAKG